MTNNTSGPDQPQEVIARLLETLRGIQFGSVEVTIHEGRIVQFERKEKIRFTAPPQAKLK